ncbi:MAG: Orange carotenoid protein [Aphanocapsa sp. GSE-SYN-MK-11-07L]|nr:Orange carotenoid protein [Aphanocapsa sp. GSE-SYN-MK-11-07L]
MTYVTTDSAPELLQAFQGLDVDQQLALFYFIYKEMGDAVTPAAPGASTVSPQIAEGLFGQVKEMSFDEQLQLQRDLIQKRETMITREYGALGNTTKLLFWYLLAQGMDSSEIVPMPSEYELSAPAQELLAQVKALGYEKQMTLFRDLVAPMGVDSTTSGRQGI